MTSAVSDLKLNNGTHVTLNPTGFQHPDFPSKKLIAAQFEPGQVWIIDASSVNYIEQLGTDEVAKQLFWPRFCWATFMFKGNLGIYTALIEHREDVQLSVKAQFKSITKPVYFLDAVAARRAFDRSETLKDLPFFWRIVYSFLG